MAQESRAKATSQPAEPIGDKLGGMDVDDAQTTRPSLDGDDPASHGDDGGANGGCNHNTPHNAWQAMLHGIGTTNNHK